MRGFTGKNAYALLMAKAAGNADISDEEAERWAMEQQAKGYPGISGDVPAKRLPKPVAGRPSLDQFMDQRQPASPRQAPAPTQQTPSRPAQTTEDRIRQQTGNPDVYRKPDEGVVRVEPMPAPQSQVPAALSDAELEQGLVPPAPAARPVQKVEAQPTPIQAQPTPVKNQPKPVESQPAPIQNQPKPITADDLRKVDTKLMRSLRRYTGASNVNSEMDRWKTLMAQRGYKNVSNADYREWKRGQTKMADFNDMSTDYDRIGFLKAATPAPFPDLSPTQRRYLREAAELDRRNAARQVELQEIAKRRQAEEQRRYDRWMTNMVREEERGMEEDGKLYIPGPDGKTPMQKMMEASRRPAPKPVPKPAPKPAPRPAAKPTSLPVAKPAQHPASKPAVRPSMKPVLEPAPAPVKRASYEGSLSEAFGLK